ncbi:MAG: substrate-binding domain-containing protein, partial [Dorea sp.]|nr:substrate-binding domain-containing protein [Dorea sp.]
PLPKKESPKGEIALFTSMFLGNRHFSSTMLDKFTREITRMGYNLSIHLVTKENLNNTTLPSTFYKERTSAVMCIEIFNMKYMRLVESLNLPLLMVDAPAQSYSEPLNGDLILMENTIPIYSLIKEMKEEGITKIGFIGQPKHCRSFFERYMAFRDAMYMYDIPIDPQFCLTDIFPHGEDYKQHLVDKLQTMKELPELFICVNDFIALDLMFALKLKEVTIPDDIKIFGFDDTSEARIVSPTISTAHIHSQVLGYTAARLLRERIKYPDKNSVIVHTETSLILRESTGHAE